MTQMGESEKLEAIKLFVQNERRRRGIKEDGLWHKSVPVEPSCEMEGEGFNLVEHQLLYTKEGCGDWQGLRGEVLDLEYAYVTNGRRG